MVITRILSILKHRSRENDHERCTRLQNIIVGGLRILDLLISIGKETIYSRNHRPLRADAAPLGGSLIIYFLTLRLSTPETIQLILCAEAKSRPGSVINSLRRHA
jgi:hypothetical protein